MGKKDPRRPVPASQLARPQTPPLVPPSSSKLPPSSTSTNRTVASRPSPSTGQGDTRYAAYTYIATPPKPGESTPILYNGDRLWVRVTLTLETAGPVAVGDKAALAPVTSGRGILLDTNQATVLTVAKGSRVYVLANTVSRIKVQIEPLPWLEQITGILGQAANAVLAKLGLA